MRQTTVTDISQETLEKEARLKALLAGYGSVAVAFSGGVDSSYLADVAHEVLGARAAILIADSPSIPRSELQEAVALARERGWNLAIIHTKEFENESYLRNDGKRCYVCKGELFQKMSQWAGDHQIALLAYGAIVEDLLDPTRLGAVAAKEHGVIAPLQEARLTKAEIRQLSSRRNLPTADKASFACLSSRFPTGTPVNLEDVARVEQAEEALRSLGFTQYRARHHGDLCRIEIDPKDFARLLEPATRQAIVRALSQAGYRFITLDLVGYRAGSSA